MTNFDLKTLGLADGTHSITVVAKASGYKDSEPSNAVDYVVGSGETITDLTGYTWVGLNDIYEGNDYEWAINFKSNNQQFTSLRYDHISGTRYYSIYYGETQVYYNGWHDTAYKTIQITGGTDATNAELISWLQENGTLTKNPNIVYPGTYLFNEEINISPYNDYFSQDIVFSSFGNSFNSIAYRNGGSSEVPYTVLSYLPNIFDAYYFSTDTWSREEARTITIETPTPQVVSQEFYEWFTANAKQLISFTIAGTTYQAENGMTWAEWVESSYNTGEYVNDGNNIYTNDYPVGQYPYYVYNNTGGRVGATEKITANYAYVLFSGGSA